MRSCNVAVAVMIVYYLCHIILQVGVVVESAKPPSLSLIVDEGSQELRNKTRVKIPTEPFPEVLEPEYETREVTGASGPQESQYDMLVTFVNGIYHSEQEVQDITQHLVATFGSNVRYFYNPSSGNWIKDATKAGFELVLRPSDLALAKDLAEHLRRALRDLHPRGRLLHIAHSGGAILTYLAAKYHLNSSEVHRIDLVTLGGGRSITRKYFKGRLRNYYARNDPVLLVEKRAAKLMKLTKNESYEEIRDAKHNTTFIYLSPIAKDPIFDHSMYGPTYRMALALEAIEFKRTLEAMQKRRSTSKMDIRTVRKYFARVTGLHHYWDAYSIDRIAQARRRVRKLAANVTNKHGFFSRKYSDIYRTPSWASWTSWRSWTSSVTLSTMPASHSTVADGAIINETGILSLAQSLQTDTKSEDTIITSCNGLPIEVLDAAAIDKLQFVDSR